MKHYAVKAIFGPTLQGEGSLVGTKTVFVRFSGCNMWDGRPETRSASKCPYCDTDFFGGERLTAKDIVKRVRLLCSDESLLVTLSGGEPLLQLDEELAKELLGAGFSLAVETNGTKAVSPELRPHLHIAMSPKVPREQIAISDCDDLKVLYPHPNPLITPEAFHDFPCRVRWVQPINDETTISALSVSAGVEKVMSLSGWRLSVQVHKVIGVE